MYFQQQASKREELDLAGTGWHRPFTLVQYQSANPLTRWTPVVGLTSNGSQATVTRDPAAAQSTSCISTVHLNTHTPDRVLGLFNQEVVRQTAPLAFMTPSEGGGRGFSTNKQLAFSFSPPLPAAADHGPRNLSQIAKEHSNSNTVTGIQQVSFRAGTLQPRYQLQAAAPPLSNSSNTSEFQLAAQAPYLASLESDSGSVPWTQPGPSGLLARQLQSSSNNHHVSPLEQLVRSRGTIAPTNAQPSLQSQSLNQLALVGLELLRQFDNHSVPVNDKQQIATDLDFNFQSAPLTNLNPNPSSSFALSANPTSNGPSFHAATACDPNCNTSSLPHGDTGSTYPPSMWLSLPSQYHELTGSALSREDACHSHPHADRNGHAQRQQWATPLSDLELRPWVGSAQLDRAIPPIPWTNGCREASLNDCMSPPSLSGPKSAPSTRRDFSTPRSFGLSGAGSEPAPSLPALGGFSVAPALFENCLSMLASAAAPSTDPRTRSLSQSIVLAESPIISPTLSVSTMRNCTPVLFENENVSVSASASIDTSPALSFSGFEIPPLPPTHPGHLGSCRPEVQVLAAQLAAVASARFVPSLVPSACPYSSPATASCLLQPLSLDSALFDSPHHSSACGQSRSFFNEYLDQQLRHSDRDGPLTPSVSLVGYTDFRRSMSEPSSLAPSDSLSKPQLDYRKSGLLPASSLPSEAARPDAPSVSEAKLTSKASLVLRRVSPRSRACVKKFPATSACDGFDSFFGLTAPSRSAATGVVPSDPAPAHSSEPFGTFVAFKVSTRPKEDACCMSAITCGHASFGFLNEENAAASPAFSEYFPAKLPVYTAESDPLQRVLYRARDVAAGFGAPVSNLCMFLKRLPNKLQHGVFQASSITEKMKSHAGLKKGAYFISENAARLFAAKVERMKALPPRKRAKRRHGKITIKCLVNKKHKKKA